VPSYELANGQAAAGRVSTGMKSTSCPLSQAQNAFNYPVFGTPHTSVDDPNFGTISDTSNSPRQGQLGLKLLFPEAPAVIYLHYCPN